MSRQLCLRLPAGALLLVLYTFDATPLSAAQYPAVHWEPAQPQAGDTVTFTVIAGVYDYTCVPEWTGHIAASYEGLNNPSTPAYRIDIDYSLGGIPRNAPCEPVSTEYGGSLTMVVPSAGFYRVYVNGLSDESFSIAPLDSSLGIGVETKSGETCERPFLPGPRLLLMRYDTVGTEVRLSEVDSSLDGNQSPYHHFGNLSEDRYRLSVEHEGFQPYAADISLRRDTALRLTLLPESATAEARGTILDDDGTPLADCPVSITYGNLSSPPAFTGVSDSTGHYSIVFPLTYEHQFIAFTASMLGVGSYSYYEELPCCMAIERMILLRPEYAHPPESSWRDTTELLSGFTCTLRAALRANVYSPSSGAVVRRVFDVQYILRNDAAETATLPVDRVCPSPAFTSVPCLFDMDVVDSAGMPLGWHVAWDWDSACHATDTVVSLLPRGALPMMFPQLYVSSGASRILLRAWFRGLPETKTTLSLTFDSAVEVEQKPTRTWSHDCLPSFRCHGLEIEAYTPAADIARLSLWTLSGRRLATLGPYRLHAGTNRIRLPRLDISGMAVLRLEVGGQHLVRLWGQPE